MSYIRKTVGAEQYVEIEIKIMQADVLRYIENSGCTDNELLEIAKASSKNMSSDIEELFKVETLEDQMKIKILQQIYKKYSLTQLSIIQL